MERLKKAKYELVYLKDVATKISDGTHFTPTYVDEGIPFISVKDIKNNSILFDDTKFITEKEHELLSKRCKPEEHDILLTKVGTIGNSIVIPSGMRPFSIFVSVALIKVDKTLINPYFLSAFFNSQLAFFQFQRSLKGIGVPDLHLESIQEIIVPLPSLEVQELIAKKYEKAYKLKRHKENKAKKIINAIDSVIAKEVGFEFPEIVERKTFAARVLQLENRLDPHFYLPGFKALLDNIRQINHAQLSDVVEFSNETWNQKDGFENEFPYIEISEIDLTSGKIQNISYTPISEAPSRARMVVRTNDIIVSTTRPHRGAIAFINHEYNGFIASTGFVVLRKLLIADISKEYLFYILRTQICLQQMLQRSSGGSYPAVTTEELKKIYIPIPSPEIQAKVVADIKAFVDNAEALKEEAKQDLEKSKQEIEALILS